MKFLSPLVKGACFLRKFRLYKSTLKPLFSSVSLILYSPLSIHNNKICYMLWRPLARRSNLPLTNPPSRGGSKNLSSTILNHVTRLLRWAVSLKIHLMDSVFKTHPAFPNCAFSALLRVGHVLASKFYFTSWLHMFIKGFNEWLMIKLLLL